MVGENNIIIARVNLQANPNDTYSDLVASITKEKVPTERLSERSWVVQERESDKLHCKIKNNIQNT